MASVHKYMLHKLRRTVMMTSYYISHKCISVQFSNDLYEAKDLHRHTQNHCVSDEQNFSFLCTCAIEINYKEEQIKKKKSKNTRTNHSFYILVSFKPKASGVLLISGLYFLTTVD